MGVKTPLLIFIDLLVVMDTQYCFEFQTCYSFIFPSFLQKSVPFVEGTDMQNHS